MIVRECVITLISFIDDFPSTVLLQYTHTNFWKILHYSMYTAYTLTTRNFIYYCIKLTKVKFLSKEIVLLTLITLTLSCILAILNNSKFKAFLQNLRLSKQSQLIGSAYTICVYYEVSRVYLRGWSRTCGKLR